MALTDVALKNNLTQKEIIKLNLDCQDNLINAWLKLLTFLWPNLFQLNENIGVTRNTSEVSSLEEAKPNIFEEMCVSVNPSDIEACHRVGPSSHKKATWGSPGRKKHVECGVWKNLKSMKL